jgi:adenine-specific DNA-methyltransferase
MLQFSLDLQRRYENSSRADDRRRKGQVFTPPEIARFMASLISVIPSEYHLLDPGAGIGCLTAAVCERLGRLRSPRRLVAHVFENDPCIVPLLRKNMDYCRGVLQEAGHSFECTIHEQDFILATSSGLNGQLTFDDSGFDVRFNGVVMNPPYFKVRKDSRYARVMDAIVHGQPNVYAFFMALAARLLREEGELVAITPRSFCNGLYFREFRQWFFRRMALDHIHLFESRTDTFRDSSVLQESVITKSHRLGQACSTITVTTSFGRDLGKGVGRSQVPADNVVDRSCGDCIVRIPGSAEDRRIIALVESIPTRFADIGLRISTGPVVMFRATEHLVRQPRAAGSAPLLLPHNVKPFTTTWPLGKNGKPAAIRMCDESFRLLVPTRNYVLLKRFSAKEERRRLVAGCFLRGEYSISHVGIENHVNYIYHADRELSEDEVYGIASVFNSTLLDRYFRTISGNTQVNATEIRTMKFPDLSTLARIGRRIRANVVELEAIVMDELGISETPGKQLLPA